MSLKIENALRDEATFKIETKKSAKSKKALNFEKLGSHTSEFNNPQVISVCENKIHVAIGYGLANVIVLEGMVISVMKNSEVVSFSPDPTTNSETTNSEFLTIYLTNRIVSDKKIIRNDET